MLSPLPSMASLGNGTLKMVGEEDFTSERRKMKSCLVSQQRQEEQLSPSIPRCHKPDNNLHPPSESHVQGRALPALDMGIHVTSMTPLCRGEPE